ncbi:class I SAM-dependent methyltransferase [Spongiivirga sp. MCCC 1A20706]|uniref:class I SAM-dependent methyltransferase n=1 Tax=Spongiivirga sp. MCCC 1A20706 TaxID=3160963 RepID=UPI003977787F
MKDHFSSHADDYVKYRPTYPSDLYRFLEAEVPNKNVAWDCGTGNGQVAFQLAKRFCQVYATDISQQQLDMALTKDNIEYSVQAAEETTFSNDLFDLVIVAQAIHWFNFEKFYAEVRRTARKNARICVVGYGLIKICPEVDNIIGDFYSSVIRPYWDDERKFIDENYKTIPFPFKEIQTPKFVNKHRWNLNHLIGYLNTWSAVKRFIKENNHNPIDDLKIQIEKYWGDTEIKQVNFPILLRLGKI